MSPRKYLAVVALAVGMVTDSWAAQRTILKALQACPNVKDFTDWFEAMEKGDASRAVDIIDGKGCVEVNKGDMVEFERLLTNPFVVCVRPIGQPQCFWTSGGSGLSVPGTGAGKLALDRKRELRRAGPSQSKSVLAGESPVG